MKNRFSMVNAFGWATFCALGLSAGAVGCSGADTGSGTDTTTASTDNSTASTTQGVCSCENAPPPVYTPPQGDECNDQFSGRATALVADLLDGKVHVVAGDTGNLPKAGGDIVASTINADIKDLIHAKVLHSETEGHGEQAKSNVTTEVELDLDLLEDVLRGLDLGPVLNGLGLGNGLGGLGGIKLPNIKIQLLDSKSAAFCHNGYADAFANSEIAAVYIDGKAIRVTADPNQKIEIGPLTIVLNQQDGFKNGSYTKADVKAVHVYWDHLVDITVSESESDIKCVCGG